MTLEVRRKTSRVILAKAGIQESYHFSIRKIFEFYTRRISVYQKLLKFFWISDFAGMTLEVKCKTSRVILAKAGIQESYHFSIVIIFPFAKFLNFTLVAFRFIRNY